MLTSRLVATMTSKALLLLQIMVYCQVRSERKLKNDLWAALRLMMCSILKVPGDECIPSSKKQCIKGELRLISR